MRAVGIVPARGGSKGIPRKNLVSLAGKPLIAWTIEAARGARTLERVIVSTEDGEIAATAAKYGAEVPFLRPRELAEDVTPTLPVIQHAVRMLEAAGDRFDAICILQPTSPLRRSAEIDGCIDLLASSGADAVVTVLRVPHEYNPHWVYFRGEDGALRISTGEPAPISRRQDLPPAFHRDGSVYVTRRDVLMERDSLFGGRLLGYEASSEWSVNIDEPEDLTLAAQVMELAAKVTAAR